MHRVGKLLGDDLEMRYVRGVYFAPSTSVPKFKHLSETLLRGCRTSTVGDRVHCIRSTDGTRTWAPFAWHMP